MKKLSERERKLRRAVMWLNKNFPQGWGVKWTKNDAEVKSLARIIKLKN